ncbi:sensor histidine kinase [Rubrivirga sp. IMCC43871]|uniref:sensor histidine kinase n=1 Tax=Rubrivirga sp. IMCC43871 TaxID=3391575 RepID=UPI00398FCB3C
MLSNAPLVLALTLLQSVALPPRTEAVLRADTLVVDSVGLGGGPSAWPYQLERTAPLGDTWVRLDDPFGGTYFAPTTMLASITEAAVAYAEGRDAKSVLFLPRAITFSALAFVVVGLVTAIVLPFALYRRRYRAERARREAAEAARRHLANGREAERLRTAQDLHDGPVQDLHALRMGLALLARSADDGQRAAIAEASADARRVVDELRRVAEDLRPPALGPFGLAAALRAFARRFAERHPGIDVALDLDDDGQALAEPVRLALFRIIQEAMTNAAKHADPTRISVGLRLEGDRATLEVADDGAGYAVPADLAIPTEPGHYGLVGMAERAGSVGAALAVHSRPGAGTRVRATAPLRTGSLPTDVT